MHRIYISEMDARAAELCREWDAGLEVIAFCAAENMENEQMIASQAARLRDFGDFSVHAPYYELAPSAIDPMIRGVAMHRFRQCAQLCARLGTRRMIVHSGYAPMVYYPQWFVPKSIEFWREFVPGLPEGFELMVENVLDVRPEYIRDVCDGVDDPRMRICLDVGHAQVYSENTPEEWIRMLGSRISHVHLHNNLGVRDEHRALEDGCIDMCAVLELLDEYAPDAALCIESVDAAASVQTLVRGGYLK